MNTIHVMRLGYVGLGSFDNVYRDIRGKNFKLSLVFNLFFRSGQNHRFASEPKGGLTCLTEPPTGPGFGVRPDL